MCRRREHIKGESPQWLNSQTAAKCWLIEWVCWRSTSDPVSTHWDDLISFCLSGPILHFGFAYYLWKISVCVPLLDIILLLIVTHYCCNSCGIWIIVQPFWKNKLAALLASGRFNCFSSLFCWHCLMRHKVAMLFVWRLLIMKAGKDIEQTAFTFPFWFFWHIHSCVCQTNSAASVILTLWASSSSSSLGTSNADVKIWIWILLISCSSSLFWWCALSCCPYIDVFVPPLLRSVPT